MILIGRLWMIRTAAEPPINVRLTGQEVRQYFDSTRSHNLCIINEIIVKVL